MSFTASLEEIVQTNRSGLLAAAPHWQRVRLGDVASVLNGYPFPSSSFTNGDGVPLLRIRDVGRDWTEARYNGEYSKTYLVRRGELVVGMDGDFRAALWSGEPALLNQRVCRITPNERVYRRAFLAHVLQGYLDAINAETSSITVKHLSSKTLADIPLPHPPLGEQDRIVALLDERLSELDAAVAALQRARANLKRYRASVLQAAFSGQVALAGRQSSRISDPAVLRDDGGSARLPTGWRWTTIGQEADVFVGATPSRRRPEYWGGPIPWVSSGEIVFAPIGSTRETVTEVGLANTSTRIHPPGTILLAMIGEGRTRGRAAILRIPACNNQNSAAICVGDTCRPEWLYYFLEASYERTRRISSGNNQPALNRSRVEAIAFPLPPIDVQRDLVQIVEERLRCADELVQPVTLAVARAARLRQSILKLAFEGRLVPQDPADEPASVLLARLEAERPRGTDRALRRPSRRNSPKGSGTW